MRALLAGPYVFIPLLLVVLGASGLGVFRYYQLSAELTKAKAEAGKGPSEEVKKLIEEVGRIIVIPTDEEPMVLTVADADKLKSRQFFVSSENGDKVLFYANARKAILYRPSLTKIIEVALINIGSTTGEPTAQSDQPKIVLLNGTSTLGLTTKYEKELMSKVPKADVVDRDNAKKRDYEKTIIVDVTGTKKAQAEELAKTLGLTVETLPKDESTRAADFIIIVGMDKK